MNIVECPRDALQGLAHYVPTALKIEYLNALLRVGFPTLDFGSFVSPKAVPQMADTPDVLAGLNLVATSTKLLAIVANPRGAEQALQYPEIAYLGFPLSVSETFQQRNTNRSIDIAFTDVATMQNACAAAGRELVVYLSMGFGNPYGDPYSPDVVSEFTAKLVALGIRHVVPSDTVGTSSPDGIITLFKTLRSEFPNVTFGAHLHSRPAEVRAKVEAVLQTGVERIDGALLGFGGCPMASDTLTGNLPTEEILAVLRAHGQAPSLNYDALEEALAIARRVFLPTDHINNR